MKIFKSVLVTFLLLTGIFSARAEIKLPGMFSDNMVLQQQTTVPVWGWTEDNALVVVKTSWNTRAYSTRPDKDGKWKIAVETPSAGGPFSIEIIQGEEKLELKNVLIGEVWLCSGQSNMEMPLKGFPGQPVKNGNHTIVRSSNDQIRLITVPRSSKVLPQKDFEGSWQVASPEHTSDFSATAWYFGSLLQEVLKVPVGLIHVSYGGSNIEAWMNEEMLKDFGDIQIPEGQEDIGEPNRTATALYNGMLAPVVGYGIKGSIWYQGESNYDRPFQYQELLIKMVKEWRNIWEQGEFPFYYAQIAPFDYSQFTPDNSEEKFNSAYLRESQLKAMKEINNSGMVVLLDVGEKNNIHPADKEKGGNRLAYRALAETYGQKGFEYASPQCKDIEIKENSVIVAFDNVPNGITSFGEEITEFEIAGEDKIFYPAKAVLRRKSVVLSAPEVTKPVAVRYAFRDFVKAQIFSTGGLPLSSFRTDNW